MSGLDLKSDPAERLLPAGENEARLYSDIGRSPPPASDDLKMTQGGYAGVVPSATATATATSVTRAEIKPRKKAAFEWPLALALCGATFATAIGWTGVLSALVYYSKFYGPASFLYLNTAVYGTTIVSSVLVSVHHVCPHVSLILPCS